MLVIFGDQVFHIASDDVFQIADDYRQSAFFFFFMLIILLVDVFLTLGDLDGHALQSSGDQGRSRISIFSKLILTRM